MYSFIKGKIVSKQANNIILENNGIGYDLIVSTNTVSNLSNSSEVCVYTYLQVKEDGLTLFGFNSVEEREMFLKLISVSGVGGKTAIQILSGTSLNELITSIIQGNSSVLKKVKGIGKKTAELICVSLREQLSSIGVGDDLLVSDIPQTTNQDIIDEAVEALIALGLKKQDALKLIKKQYTGTESVEDLITKALKNMR